MSVRIRRWQAALAVVVTAILLPLLLQTTPASAGAGSDTLFGNTNETLVGASLFSGSRVYEAKMQTDGNFVLYGPGGPLWATYTHGSVNTRLVMQSDGNLVMYDGGTPIFASGTSGTGARLLMQNDGNLVIYAASGAPIWSTYTGGGANRMAASGAVAWARTQLGKPYVFGATGPDSYDCSGLTQRAYSTVGVPLPRTSEQQYGVGAAIARADLQPGDLLFYVGQGAPPGHEAIYIGNGQIIEALHTGTNVRIDGLDFPGGYLGARRVA